MLVAGAYHVVLLRLVELGQLASVLHETVHTPLLQGLVDHHLTTQYNVFITPFYADTTLKNSFCYKNLSQI